MGLNPLIISDRHGIRWQLVSRVSVLDRRMRKCARCDQSTYPTPLITPWLPKSCHFTVHGFLPLCLSPLCYHWSTFQPNSIYKSKHARTRFAIRQLAMSSPPCIPYARHPVCYTRYVTLCLTTLPPVRDHLIHSSTPPTRCTQYPVCPTHMPTIMFQHSCGYTPDCPRPVHPHPVSRM